MLFTLVRFPKQQDKNTERGVKLGQTELDMQVVGSMVQPVAKVHFITRMAMFLRGTFETTKLTEREATLT